jgi:hypothetical protein
MVGTLMTIMSVLVLEMAWVMYMGNSRHVRYVESIGTAAKNGGCKLKIVVAIIIEFRISP